MEISLRRYTELPFVIDFLQTKELVLLNPSTWNDKNDTYFIEQYAKTKSVTSTAALCLTECNETYHHWSVFSNGTSGVCIIFNKEKLIDALKDVSNLRAESVEYKTIKNLEKNPPNINDLPFLKRIAFKDESEFRLFWECDKTNENTFKVKIPISAIEKIVLSPWLPRTVAKNVKNALRLIPECNSIVVTQSLLIEHEKWKQLANSNA